VGLRLRGEGILDHPVEFVHDPESGGWAFRVPSLHITGGAQTEDQAKEMAREAILSGERCPMCLDPYEGGCVCPRCRDELEDP
jgi:hypothetical protein